jgi:hypothetical protein
MMQVTWTRWTKYVHTLTHDTFLTQFHAHTHTCNDGGHTNRVHKIRLPRSSKLPFMHFFCVFCVCMCALNMYTTCIYLCVYDYVCIYVCVYVCMHRNTAPQIARSALRAFFLRVLCVHVCLEYVSVFIYVCVRIWRNKAPWHVKIAFLHEEHVYIYIYIYRRTSARGYKDVCICACMYMCMYVYVHVCNMCIYTRLYEPTQTHICLYINEHTHIRSTPGTSNAPAK